jgi:hypothetical protein
VLVGSGLGLGVGVQDKAVEVAATEVWAANSSGEVPQATKASDKHKSAIRFHVFISLSQIVCSQYQY